MSNKTDKNSPEKSKVSNRRKLLVGGGIIGAGSALPTKWTNAVVNTVVLPAHAQTTDPTGGGGNATPSPAQPPQTPAPGQPPQTPAPSAPTPAPTPLAPGP